MEPHPEPKRKPRKKLARKKRKKPAGKAMEVLSAARDAVVAVSAVYKMVKPMLKKVRGK